MRLSHTMSAEPMRARHQERESGLSQERESCLSHDERVAACPVRTRRKPRRTQLAPLFRSPGFSRSGGSGEVFITRAWYSAFFMRTVLHQRAARSTRQPWLQTTDLMREVRGSTHVFSSRSRARTRPACMPTGRGMSCSQRHEFIARLRARTAIEIARACTCVKLSRAAPRSRFTRSA